MKAEHFAVEELALAGWPVRVTTYLLGTTWHAKADNVSPGANIARSQGLSRQQARAAVVEKASQRLAATRRVPLDAGG